MIHTVSIFTGSPEAGREAAALKSLAKIGPDDGRGVGYVGKTFEKDEEESWRVGGREIGAWLVIWLVTVAVPPMATQLLWYVCKIYIA